VGKVVLDTSVLLGVLDPTDILHTAAREAVLEQRSATHSLVVPTSVLAESLVGAHRQGPVVARRVTAAIEALADEVVPLDRAIAEEAAKLRAQRPAIRLPDALVIATGRESGVVAILTADKRWVGIDHKVMLIEP
jgi:predicted nucleic acid-binding protein